MPDNVATAHFNAIKGLNSYSKVPKIVIAGRALPPPKEVEQRAAVLTGNAPQPSGGDWYPKRSTRIRTRGGIPHLVPSEHHPDPMAEEIRWQICEAELIQAIGRARGLRRTADNPLEIDILTSVPLPIPVDEVTTWKDIIPDEFEVLLAQTGIVPLSKAELHRLYPERFKNPDAARYALRAAGGADGIVDRVWGGKTPISTHIGNLPPQTHPWVVRYKRPGRGHGPNWITALVHPRFADPGALRMTVEAVTGPIAAFELLPQHINHRHPALPVVRNTWQVTSFGYTESARVYVRSFPEGHRRWERRVVPRGDRMLGSDTRHSYPIETGVVEYFALRG